MMDPIQELKIKNQETHYRKKLGLTRSPFSSGVEQDFYCSLQSFEQRLNILHRLVQGRDFLILVIGEKGSGKTMLLKRFLTHADANWRKCRIHARTSGQDTGFSFDNLNHHPAFILQDAPLPVVMFDDAHELTDIELQYLLKDALAPNSTRKLKRLVLFCEPAIHSKLAGLPSSITGETTVNKLFIPLIDEKDTAEYLKHRLFIAGYMGKSVFNTACVKWIHRASDGLPGLINIKAHNWLEQKYSRNKQGILKKSTRAILSICLSAVLILAILLISLINRSPGPVKDHSPDSSARVPSSHEAPKVPPNTIPATGTPNKSFTAHSKIDTNFIIFREPWIRSQNSSAYTIQIIGTRSEEALIQYIRKHNLPSRGKVAYYQSEYKGAPWFQVIYGIYPTPQKATEAIDKLPVDIRKLSPWIRSISSVKSVLGKNKKN